MNQFNLRVYGFIINKNQEVLLSDEFRFESFFTKFPGGGVEYGGGVFECGGVEGGGGSACFFLQNSYSDGFIFLQLFSPIVICLV